MNRRTESSVSLLGWFCVQGWGWGWGQGAVLSHGSLWTGVWTGVSPGPQPCQRQEDPCRLDPKRKISTDWPREEGGGGRGCPAEETVSGAQAWHPASRSSSADERMANTEKRGSRRGEGQWTHRPTPTPSQIGDLGRGGSLAGWGLRPVFSLNLGMSWSFVPGRAGDKPSSAPLLPPPSSVPAPQVPVPLDWGPAGACPPPHRRPGRPSAHFLLLPGPSPCRPAPTPPSSSFFKLLQAGRGEGPGQGSLPPPHGAAPRAAGSGTTAARSPGVGSRRSRRGSSRGRRAPCAPATGSPGGTASRPAAPARRPKAAGRAWPTRPRACFPRGHSLTADCSRLGSERPAGGGQGGARGHVARLKPPAPSWLRASARSGGTPRPKGLLERLPAGPMATAGEGRRGARSWAFRRRTRSSPDSSPSPKRQRSPALCLPCCPALAGGTARKLGSPGSRVQGHRPERDPGNWPGT